MAADADPRTGLRREPPVAAVRRAASQPDLVLFDLDGTITDSQSGIAATYRHTLRRLGLPRAPDADIRACIGPPLTLSLASLGVPAGRMEEAVGIWRSWFGVHGIFDNEVYTGVDELLAGLTAAGVRMGLATSKLRTYAVEILDHFDLHRYFDPVVGASADGRLTHKDEIIAAALLEAGAVDPGGVVMVGDREHDMWGAAANGVAPVGVTYGYGSREELLAGGARWLVGTPSELRTLLLGWPDRSEPTT